MTGLWRAGPERIFTTVAKIEAGQKAPPFTLRSGDGKTVSLSDYLGNKNVVLYFYPKDDTPGCTKEACAFRDDWAEFGKLNTQVLGVSRDPEESHQKFSRKFDLPFPLLSDTEGEVVQDYGVWQEKNMYGKKAMGIVRSTFVIDTQGVVRKVFPKVSVDGHSQAILDFIRRNLA